MSYDWLGLAKRIQAIAQSGLTYSKGKFDIERYEMLREIGVEIMSQLSDTEVEKVRELFANETGYQTPKVEVRAVVFHENKLLMVREEMDGKWSMPGGWADIGYSPAEVAVKEAREEAGVIVEATRLLGIMDQKNHARKPSPYHTYKILILCRWVGGELKSGLETTEVRFFGKGELPELSEIRNTKEQVLEVFKFLEDENKEAILE